MFRPFRKLRNHAHATLSQAQGTMSVGQRQMLELATKALDIMDEISDGVRIRPVKDGEGTLWQFITGKIDECPISFRLEIDEPDEDKVDRKGQS